MLTEKFLDLVLELYLTKKPEKLFNGLVVKNDLIMIIDYCKEKEIPVKIKPKFELVKYMVEQVNLDVTSPDLVLDDLSKSAKFEQFVSQMQYLCSVANNRVRIDEILQLISHKRESILIDHEKGELEAFLDKYNSGNFSTTKEMIEQFESLIGSVYVRTLLKKKYDDTVLTNEFSFNNIQSVQDALKLVQTKSSEGCHIKTGFKVLDDGVLKGGFENGRIYIFGGTPGVGKSMFMLRFLLGAIQDDRNDDGLYIYVTLENFIHESVARFINMVSSTSSIINGEKSEIVLTDVVKKFACDKGKEIHLKYFPPYSTSVNDIMIYIDELSMKTGKKPKIVFIDYLDLMTSVNKTEMYRIELGFITMEQKTIAIKYNVPVITATQLNSAGYNNAAPTLEAITESKKKVEHADYVGLFCRRDDVIDMNNPRVKRIVLHTRKNRNGPLDDASFIVDYELMKIDAEGSNFNTLNNGRFGNSGPTTPFGSGGGYNINSF